MDDDRKIRERAHQIWVEEGKPEGREADHWNRAVQELGFGDEQQGGMNTGTDSDVKRPQEITEGGGISPGQVPPPD